MNTANQTIDANSVFLAFNGYQRIGKGSLEEVRLAVRAAVGDAANASTTTPWIFNAQTGEPIDIDLDTPVLVAHPTDDVSPLPLATAKPGRPKLGVEAHEVTLLPRHWEWLKSQQGGASVALRKLVDTARKSSQHTDNARLAQAALYRFVSAIAGNLAGFEEASRAMFANDRARFFQLISSWPHDVHEHIAVMAENAFLDAKKDFSDV
jgi:uncharacterized protein